MDATEKSASSVKTSRLYSWTAALLAFAAWGGWAFFINRSSGLSTGITSGVAQGTGSLVMTFVMIRVVTGIFNRLTNRWMRLAMPTVITVGSAACFLVLVHSLVGTPHIFWTILPGLSGAVPFCLLTSYKLQRQAQ
jgi:hypothetical protein